MENFELDWLKKWAQYSPTKIALSCADTFRTFTYKELYERSLVLAKNLQTQHSISAGDRVAVLALNEPETIILFFACVRLGAILVPINYRLAPREILYVTTDCEPKIIFVQDQFKSSLEMSAKEASVLSFENDLCQMIADSTVPVFQAINATAHSPVMILYTSGTTGAAKGALITHNMLFWNSINTGLRLNITPSDSAIIFHPFFHTSGWNVLTTPFLHHGASITLLKKFDADKILSLCHTQKVSILFGVPTMMDMMARSSSFETAKLHSIRFAVVGGEPMSVELIKIWAQRGIPVRQGFGLTEFGPNVFSLNEEDAIKKIGSIGFPNFYIDVKIIDGSGEEILEPNRVGELCLKGPACTPGYWRNTVATSAAIKDGWFYTGDLVRRDEHGYYYVAGRKKEMFISGAENVYPAEVESYLRGMPGIHEVAVIGVPDQKWGEVGHCFFSTLESKPMEETVFRNFAIKGLAKYKVPKYFTRLEALPKGDSGKIQKTALAKFTQSSNL